jgi:hypothetical protein
MSKADEEAESRKAAREFERAKAQDRPFAAEVLRRLLAAFTNLTIRYQPTSPEADEAKFRYWSERAADVAKALLPFEAPRLATVALPPAPPAEDEPRRFTLRVFGFDHRLGRRVEYAGPGSCEIIDPNPGDQPPSPEPPKANVLQISPLRRGGTS